MTTPGPSHAYPAWRADKQTSKLDLFILPLLINRHEELEVCRDIDKYIGN